MFDSLADQMKHDEQEVTSNKQRVLQYTVIGVLSVLVFVGLYMGIRMAG